MREIVLDTETTGLDPQSGHRIIEIGCVELVNYIPTGRTFHRYVNPEREVPRPAQEVHGLSTEFLADKPLFADIVDEFVDFIGDSTLVIHNAGFDLGFLNAEFLRIPKPVITTDRVVDTLALARRKHPAGPNSLDALCKRYGIDNSTRDKHGALLDSELLARVYLELIGGYQAHFELEKTSATADSHACGSELAIFRRPRPIRSRLTEKERASHEAFVEELGQKALWLNHLNRN